MEGMNREARPSDRWKEAEPNLGDVPEDRLQRAGGSEMGSVGSVFACLVIAGPIVADLDDHSLKKKSDPAPEVGGWW